MNANAATPRQARADRFTQATGCHLQIRFSCGEPQQVVETCGTDCSQSEIVTADTWTVD